MVTTRHSYSHTNSSMCRIIHSFTRSLIHLLSPLYIHPLIHSVVPNSFSQSPKDSFTNPSLICSFSPHSFIHSLYPLTHVFMPSFSHLLFHSGTHQAFRCSLLHSCIQSFAQSPTSLNAHTFIHSVTRSLTAIHVLPPHQPGQPLPASLVLSLQPEHQIPPNFMVQPRVPQHCAELTS